MLTEKQHEIIEQIKQEFESHNQVIDLRKKDSSLFNFEGIISHVQERDDFIAEQYASNIANYRAVELSVLDEIDILNKELKLLGFVAYLREEYNKHGNIWNWQVYLSKINASSNQDRNLMTLGVHIDYEELFFKDKRISGHHRIFPTYKYGYSNYAAKDMVSLFKIDKVREHLTRYWERYNK